MPKVAVYGSLRKGMGNHGLMHNTNYIGTTEVHGVTMYDLGAFPRVALGHGTTSITVEVYEVTEEQLSLLDRLEGYRGASYNNFYNRSLVNTSFGEVFIYHIEQEGGDPVVEGGDWVSHYYGVAA